MQCTRYKKHTWIVKPRGCVAHLSAGEATAQNKGLLHVPWDQRLQTATSTTIALHCESLFKPIRRGTCKREAPTPDSKVFKEGLLYQWKVEGWRNREPDRKPTSPAQPCVLHQLNTLIRPGTLRLVSPCEGTL